MLTLDEQALAPYTTVRRVLAPDGTPVGPEPELTSDQLLTIYRWLVFLRTHDQRLLTLQRQGRLGTFAPLSGQEASQVGSAFALEPQDWLFPTYRDHGAMMVHGVPEVNVIRYFMGDEWGGRAPDGVRVFPISIPIATQLLHAAGAAWAGKIKGERWVAIGYAGDGGTSPGDFHEALNIASVFELPVVFFIQNNRYAISVPLARQMKSRTIAQRAVAYDIPGVRVDGQDVLAVYSVVQEAVDRARSGGGPTLIESLTYRYGPHTTSDDPKRYRPEAEVSEWQQLDPIERMRRYLVLRGLWDEGREEELQNQVREQVAAAVAEAEAMGRPDPAAIFDYVYEKPTPRLEAQKAQLLERLARRQKEAAARA
ncbi:pyruvate dehydrogenase (acetyl-transferring) E1 component subunit alpha [Caldinitratiruptor microaerophilus]|uniref:Pyruvate dehydrogenase E1 component subunit alpha n=1 Tax=Caldinitratiruptor microaerophilus TaxID=671077 RepID=A0AA35G749_9FIRM|nr:pyruvate dehydrogenase (acetyl-transferring) E1 component subunit alpha [Caldinitratiruptor microaerophilus]BDG62281.1 pyruvate dehydrogenase (acetyl-transferring) E1 component subunit alpha [Caldinitratiruptor microaerophilus]